MAFRLLGRQHLKNSQNFGAKVSAHKRITANPRIITLTINLLVIISVITLLGSVRKNGSVRFDDYQKDWYYDLNTGRLFVGDTDAPTSFAAPAELNPNDRSALAKAYVFSYVREGNDSQRFVGFLEINGPNYGDYESNNGNKKLGREKLVRRIEDKTWYSADSRQGQEIITQTIAPNKDGKRPYYCPPK